MKKRILLLICIIAGIILSETGFSGGMRSEAETKKPDISADSAMVLDVNSGAVIYSKNPDKKEYPASITKVMTALLAIENSSLSETVTYSTEAVTNLESGASNIEIAPGEKISMEESLYAILLMSANEACNGVAEHIAGSIKEFAKMMNKRAKELGCTGTHFANANGLWMKNHYTTAHDMALIARAAYKNKTFAKITGTKRFNMSETNKRSAGYPLHNHHGMLLPLNFPQYEYKYCVGGKTGYTSQCKYTLVTYAKKKGMTLVSVIMRAPYSPWTEPNEYTDTISLLNYGFNNFKRHKITDNLASEINRERIFSKFSSFYDTDTSSIFVDEDAGVLLPKGASFSDTEKKVEYYPTPEDIGGGKKVIGHISYTYNGEDVGGTDIYYEDRGAPSLKDSIDMKQWFDEAVEKAQEAPFPWMVVIIVGAILVLLGIAGFLFLPQFLDFRDSWVRSHRYKKNKKSGRNMDKFN